MAPLRLLADMSTSPRIASSFTLCKNRLGDDYDLASITTRLQDRDIANRPRSDVELF